MPPQKTSEQILSRWSVAETIFPKEKSEALILLILSKKTEAMPPKRIPLGHWTFLSPCALCAFASLRELFHRSLSPERIPLGHSPWTFRAPCAFASLRELFHRSLPRSAFHLDIGHSVLDIGHSPWTFPSPWTFLSPCALCAFASLRESFHRSLPQSAFHFRTLEL